MNRELLRWARPLALCVALGCTGLAQAQQAAAPASVPAASAGGEAAGSLPSAIPVRREAAAKEGDALGQGTATVAALAVVALLGYLGLMRLRRAGRPAAVPHLRRWLGAPAGREIVLGEVARLTPRHSVHVVQWNGRKLLVGCTEQGIALLGDAPVQAEREAA